MILDNEKIMDMFREIDQYKNPNKKIQLQNEIIKKTAFLVYKNAKRYKKMPNYQDLVQEGYYGLVKAARAFDHNKFPNFYVYAEMWIKNMIRRSAKKFDVVYNPNRKRTVYAEPKETEVDPELTPEEKMMYDQKNAYVRGSLKALSSREERVLCGIFEIGSEKRAMADLGREFNISNEAIRKTKIRAINKLGKNCKLKELA